MLPIIAEVVRAEVARDGQLGVCVDVSMMLTKILEEEGIWCYALKGALTVLNPALAAPILNAITILIACNIEGSSNTNLGRNVAEIQLL